jgi:hypothetical protein
MCLVSRSAGVLLLGFWIAVPGWAQTNQVTNGSFDMDVAGWTPVQTFMSVSFDPEDVDGSADSGSARVTFMSTLGLDTSGHIAQCVGVVPDRTYAGSTSFRIPASQDRPGSAGMRIAWHTSNDCSGQSPEFGFGNASNFVGPWADLTPVLFTAPIDARSAQVQLQINKPVLGGQLVILFDEVMFVPEPSATQAALTALVALVVLARQRRRT